MPEPFDQQLAQLREVASEGFGDLAGDFPFDALAELLRRWDAIHNVELSRTCQGCRVTEPRAYFVDGQRKCEACAKMAVGT